MNCIDRQTHRHRPFQRNDLTLWMRMVGEGSEFARQSVRDSVAWSMYDA